MPPGGIAPGGIAPDPGIIPRMFGDPAFAGLFLVMSGRVVGGATAELRLAFCWEQPPVTNRRAAKANAKTPFCTMVSFQSPRTEVSVMVLQNRGL